MGKIKIPVLFICAIILSAGGCSLESENLSADKFYFTDSSGINFSLEITPCTNNKSNGKIVLFAENSENNTYLYSMGFAASFQRINGNSVTLNKLKSGSYSFRLMRKSDNEVITDIYTVYLSNKGDDTPMNFTAASKSEKIIDDGEIKITAQNNDTYEVSTDGQTWQAFEGNTAVIRNLSKGMYKISVREKNNPENITVLDVPVVHADTKVKNNIDAVQILQKPELPSGCEVTSLTMLLNYIGFDVDKLIVADEYLPKGEYRKSDYNKVFVGNPRSIFAYGCTAEVIEKTAENFLSDNDTKNKWQVKNITGCGIETLYSAIDNGCPAVVWASIDMQEIIPNHTVWTDAETDNEVSWVGNEHCLLLTGYDRNKRLVYVNDPLHGSMSYDMKTFESRFIEMNSNAVIIIPQE